MGRTLLGNVSLFAGVFAAGAMTMIVVDHLRSIDEPEHSEQRLRDDDPETASPENGSTDDESAVASETQPDEVHTMDDAHLDEADIETGESVADVLNRLEAAYARGRANEANQTSPAQRTEVVIVVRDERTHEDSSDPATQAPVDHEPPAELVVEEAPVSETVLVADVGASSDVEDEPVERTSAPAAPIYDYSMTDNRYVETTRIDQRETNVARSSVTVVSAPAYYVPWSTTPVWTAPPAPRPETRPPPSSGGARPTPSVLTQDPFRPVDSSKHNDPWARWGGGVP